MVKLFIIEAHGGNILMKQNKPFTFLTNKGWRGTSWDRGGVQYVIKAFAEEFSKDEKVEIILKLNPAYINPAMLDGIIKGMKLPEDRAKINICTDNVPFNKMGHLYKDSDCFICATRAESFNLPGLEAMSCGLPTIQTNYGGQTDYMTDDNSLFIKYTLEEVKEDLMYEGISWATPDMIDLKNQMRFAFENQDKFKEKGKQAEEDSKNWTWDISANKLMGIFKNI